MKKITLAAGYLAVVCIAIFATHKIMHWPGANVAAIAGSVLFSLIYAPLLYWERLKTSDTMLKKVFNLVVMAAMVFFGGSFLAYVMHWCGNPALACIAYSLMILVILLQVFRAITETESEGSMGRHNLSIVSAIVLTVVVFMELTTMPKSILTDFNQNIATQRLEIQFYTNKTNALFDNLDKTSNIPGVQDYLKKAEAVRAQSDSLIFFIRSMGESMMFMADGQKISFDSTENLCKRGNMKVGEKFMTEERNDSIYQLKLKGYTDFLSANTNSRGKEVLDLFFAKQDSASSAVDCSTTNCCSRCYCKSVISVIMDLNADILHIRMLESETINYLQTMQAKVPRD